MSVYNVSPFIREAIQSIIDQTFTDFEFLIFNDGSTDNSLEIINFFKDPRIQVFSYDKNRGIATNANEGISRARGKYIARMDGDDISLPQRFEKEFNFLETHPDFGMIGGWIANMDASGSLGGEQWKFVAPPEEIPVTLLFNNYFANSTTMIRKSALPPIPYKKELITAEDYDLWTKIANTHRVWNLQEVLVHYRIHDKNISLQKTEKTKQGVQNIFKEQLLRLGVSYTKEQLDLHYHLSFETVHVDLKLLKMVESWYVKIYEANNTTNKYDKVLLLKTLLGRWYILCRKLNENQWVIFTQIFNSQLLRKNSLGLRDFARLAKIVCIRLFRYD